MPPLLHRYLPIFLGLVLCAAAAGCDSAESPDEQEPNSSESPISSDMFEHHYIATDMPSDNNWGYGTPASADFDQDGDNDFAFGVRADSIYWFEFTDAENWTRHAAGPVPVRTLGGNTMDVDGDGWQDIITGGYWYQNPQNPTEETFEMFRYDDRIDAEIHDVVPADIDGDGSLEVAVMGDGLGAFWYDIPDDPATDENWTRHTITMAVLADNEAIHSGFFPKGIDDLDGDGDADIVLPDRWLENRSSGTEWTEHSLPFGKRGPWGLSSRSWIIDLDGDGDMDIVAADSDQTGSRVAWLENDGSDTPSFTARMLPKEAPGTRGSFHSLSVRDFDGDGDVDIFAVEQEDTSIFPEGATPRWYIWENVSSADSVRFAERVIFDGRLGGHDAYATDVDADGDVDIVSKIWKRWPENANDGREHGDYLENLSE